ncbi:Uma2 family endonuclease [Candidatus Electronema sp. TJ]|uniref:Uma2 family endonuclease n=1 Tax=Candidatus Electronema sp. TJ TaxID=3401573 RepID=UPI003AA9179B
MMNLNQSATWQELCSNSSLHDLPFKIESNQQGQLLMTPVKVYHSLFKGKITGLLYAHIEDGEVLVECAVRTQQGTKVADVAWASSQRLELIQDEAECSVAPEICIEVMSSANTEAEMLGKRTLYCDNGAQEFWICDQQGRFRFFSPDKELARSLLLPDFPATIR